jgi:manganese/zinc/iron transport system ATP- binding protein
LTAVSAVIDLRGVSAGYDGRPAISGVDLVVREGEMLALVGGNGAGKSTLLKVLVGIIRPIDGTATVFGAEPGTTRRVSYLPQSEELHWDYPLIVEDVVLMARLRQISRLRGVAETDRALARKALEQVNAGDLARRPIGALSGGQKQRVLVARALASEAELFLLDEPATGVDPTTEEDLMRVLEGLSRGGRTVIVSTHDLASVMAHFPRVVALNRGIVADGPSAILTDADILRRTYGGHRAADPALVADEHHA